MATGYEVILAEVEARLTGSPAFMDDVRRGHLTIISRDEAPRTHIVGGDDDPEPDRRCGARRANFIVALFTRDDAGSAAADAYLIELYARMAQPFPNGICVKPGSIERETEITDADASRTDCHFSAEYATADEWSLELPA